MVDDQSFSNKNKNKIRSSSIVSQPKKVVVVVVFVVVVVIVVDVFVVVVVATVVVNVVIIVSFITDLLCLCWLTGYLLSINSSASKNDLLVYKENIMFQFFKYSPPQQFAQL